MKWMFSYLECSSVACSISGISRQREGDKKERIWLMGVWLGKKIRKKLKMKNGKEIWDLGCLNLIASWEIGLKRNGKICFKKKNSRCSPKLRCSNGYILDARCFNLFFFFPFRISIFPFLRNFKLGREFFMDLIRSG